MDNKFAKSLILEIEEAKRETSAAINKILREHKLPCYLYESIIEDVHNQISAAAKNEVSTVVSEYEDNAKKPKRVRKKKRTKPKQNNKIAWLLRKTSTTVHRRNT